MNTPGIAELIVSICHFERFSKSAITICNSEAMDTSGRKTSRTQTTAKRYAFHANAMIYLKDIQLWQITDMIVLIT